jgi:hypothetical protein
MRLPSRALLIVGLLCSPWTAVRAERLEKEYGPFDLAAKRLMIMPSQRVHFKLPPDRLVTAVEMRTAAEGGRTLDCGFICHNNFGPNYNRFQHGRKILLDGYTPRLQLPAGYGLEPQREDFLAELMYNNPESSPIHGVRTKFAVELAPKGAKLTALYPQMMSVFEQPPATGLWGYYVGPKRVDIRSRLFDVLEDFEARHVTFHIHDHGRRIILRNKTTGETIVDAKPVYENGVMKSMPQVELPGGRFARKGQVLELVVEYDNPTERTIDTMGAAILFMRCTAPGVAPSCDAVAQRRSDPAGFDPRVYASLIGGEGARARHHHAR